MTSYIINNVMTPSLCLFFRNFHISCFTFNPLGAVETLKFSQGHRNGSKVLNMIWGYYHAKSKDSTKRSPKNKQQEETHTHTHTHTHTQQQQQQQQNHCFLLGIKQKRYYSFQTHIFLHKNQCKYLFTNCFLPIVFLPGPPSLYKFAIQQKASKTHRWHQLARSDGTGLSGTAVISVLTHVTRFRKIC